MADRCTDTQWGIAMAGRGDPFALLTPERQTLVQALHAGTVPDDDLQPLLDAQLLHTHGAALRPAFLVIECAETLRCIDHARGAFAPQLAAPLLAQWDTLITTFAALCPDRRDAWADDVLFLVGARLLDIVLLDVLARDGLLMSAAPARIGADGGAEQYFLWMVERPADFPSFYYGQNVTPLPWDGWFLLTFGVYSTADGPNVPRQHLITTVRKKAADVDTPAVLAAQMALRCYDHAAVTRWDQVAYPCAEALLAVYHVCADDLRALYNTLKCSTYHPDGFGSFVCWYDHLAYTAVIDLLIAQGLVHMPADRFTAALWQGPVMPDLG